MILTRLDQIDRLTVSITITIIITITGHYRAQLLPVSSTNSSLSTFPLSPFFAQRKLGTQQRRCIPRNYRQLPVAQQVRDQHPVGASADLLRDHRGRLPHRHRHFAGLLGDSDPTAGGPVQRHRGHQVTVLVDRVDHRDHGPDRVTLRGGSDGVPRPVEHDQAGGGAVHNRVDRHSDGGQLLLDHGGASVDRIRLRNRDQSGDRVHHGGVSTGYARVVDLFRAYDCFLG